MTLAQRMTLRTCALTTALVIVAVTAGWGLLAARKSARIARGEYTELRMILSLGEHLMAARGMLETGTTPESTDAELSGAVLEMGNLVGFQDQKRKNIPSHKEEREYLQS